jgi:hypothetical protein
MKRVILIIFVFYIYAFNLRCQKVELVSGNPKLFRDVKFFYLTFDYSDLVVGKYGDEQAYIDYMKDDAERRKKGSSEEWLKKWYEDRVNFYQPKFIELFDEYSDKDVKSFSNLSNQKFELNLHTKFIDPGFNRNAKRAPALINVIVTISEIGNRENALIISMTDVPGNEVMGSYYPDYRRIAEAYAKCGKELAYYMSRVIY